MSEAPSNNFTVNRELRPNPDPTSLTTEQIRQEISWLRTLLEAKLEGRFESLTMRLDAMEKALSIIQAFVDRLLNEVDVKIDHRHELHDEKFRSISTQFSERDIRAEQGSRDSKTAVDAALQAAKEAVGKTEMGFTKQIDQLMLQTQTETRGLSSQIGEVKDRLESAVSSVSARAEASVASLRAELLPQITGERARGDRGEGRQMGQGAMIGMIFGGIGAISVIIGIIAMISKLP